MGKIGDLWVRLGLKGEDYKKGMQDAKKETTSFGEGLGKMKAGALAVWAAIGAGVTKFAKEFVNHSQTMGDAWNQATGKMSAVWSQFLTSLTSWDWEGFGQRIRNAMDTASESILAHDAEFEVGNSIKLRRAQMSEELADLQIVMRDTRKSYDERAKAAEDYLNKIKPIYEAEEDLRKRIYMTDTNEYLANAGLAQTADNRDLLRTFFTDVAPNESLMAVLNEYQKKVQGKKRYNLSKEDYKAIDEFYAKYGNQSGAALSVLAQYYQSTNDEIATKVVDAITNYDNSIALFAEETRRIQTLLNTALAQLMKDVTGDASVVPQIDIPEIEDMELIDFDLEIPEIKTEALDNALEDVYTFNDEMQAEMERVAALNGMLSDTIVASLSGGVQALTDMMFELEGADPSQLLSALMQPFANTATQLGEMLIAQGLGIEAFKKSLESLNGAAAIAAGAGLLALGAAMRSGIQALASGGAGGGSSMSYGGSSYSGASTTQNYENTLTVEVTGRISGNDIVIAGNKTNNNLGR